MEADNIIKNVDMYDLGVFLVNQGWKIQSELTPRANVSLTPENFLILTP